MIKLRLKNARLWIIFVLAYYSVKACLIIYPTYHTRNASTQVIEIIQTILAVVIIIAVLQSYKYSLLHLRWFLYVQAFQISLGNLTIYRHEEF